MKIFIKHMISPRCIILVKDELNALGLLFTGLELGSVDLLDELTEEKHVLLAGRLLESGLELQNDKKGILVEKIKRMMVGFLSDPDRQRKQKYSAFLSKTLNYEYNYLSNVFSEVEGMSIQQFIILHKVEMVKELLCSGELNLTEIAYKLNYSSNAHLSNQFKHVTGLTPSLFKNLKNDSV